MEDNIIFYYNVKNKILPFFPVIVMFVFKKKICQLFLPLYFCFKIIYFVYHCSLQTKKYP